MQIVQPVCGRVAYTHSLKQVVDDAVIRFRFTHLVCRGPKAGRALFFGEGQGQGEQADLVFGGVTVITGKVRQGE